jgi:dienelactone hydrolase
MKRSGLLALVLFAVVCLTSAAQPQTIPPPSAETLKTIEARKAQLGRVLEQLRQAGVRDPFLADIEIYYKAADWIVRHKEYFNKDDGDRILGVLDRGLLRASQQARGEVPWLQVTGRAVSRAYRSAVDGSVQPYAVTFPADYGKDPNRRWRLDVVLHGRNAKLTEVSFLHSTDYAKAAPADQGFVKIDIYGRGNNAYRWAGETDVNEAVENFLAVEQALGRARLLDPAKLVLRGFSMGGAGTWHLGLHRPSRWCVIGPGAGFTTTHGYVGKMPAQLPPEQEACLRIYDAVDYAENAADVPVVAYSGSEDPQMKAAVNIEAKLKPLGIPMTHLVAPGLAHQFPAEWQKKAEQEYAKYATKGREEYPRRVHFVTYTLKYNECDWLEILGLDRHYERTVVEAEWKGDSGFNVKTANVRALSLRLPPGATRQAYHFVLDGQEVEARPYFGNRGQTLHVALERQDGKWSAVLPEKLLTDRLRHPQKTTNLQGPIDDAFMSGFLCVRGTSQPWHEATDHYAVANLDRFRAEWSKYLRGELPVKNDVDVTAEDIATHHLILFGDPASNSLIKQVLPGLPLKWTKETITWDGKDYAASEHVPVLIYPSPLNTERYVVLNSGHTFHAADFEGTNALLYPRLGDYAILKLSPGKQDPLAVEVQRAGLFDDFWRPVPRP